MKQGYFISLITTLLILIGCNFDKKYYYFEDSDEAIVIEAPEDSTAYKEAFQKFQIAVEAHEAVGKATGGSLTKAPRRFTLLNSEKKDITFTTYFASKDEYERMAKIAAQDAVGSANVTLAENDNKQKVEDSINLSNAPVKILAAKFVSKEYSNYKEVYLSYKNISGKAIEAIRFKWYGENAFGEPADMSGPRDGWGGGFTDDVLKPGRTDNGTWNVLSKDGKKIITAYPYEVAFTDGTKWQLNN